MSLIPSQFLDSVVAIGRRQPDSSIQYTATGFVYSAFAGLDEEGDRLARTFLVTNRHVIEGAGNLFSRQSHPSGVHIVSESLEEDWVVHPDSDVDIAVLPILSVSIPNPSGISFGQYMFHDETNTLVRARLIDMEFREGNEVFVLGFPLAMVGGDKNYVIARQGIIARIQDWFDDAAKCFLIDASIFPGNSGGPVLAKPTLHTYGATITTAMLIGVVTGYLPYRDIARSDQTGHPILSYVENSGLAVVVPVDAIDETIAVAVRQYEDAIRNSSE